MEGHHVKYNLSLQWLDKWVDRWEKAVCREMRRMQVYNLYVECCRGPCGLRFIWCCPSVSLPPPPTHPHLLVSPSLPVQWQLCCPQRDGWESVALPLQSYRSTAAGVTSSALPLCSPPLLFLSSVAKLAAATHWPQWEILFQLLDPYIVSPNYPAFHALLLHMLVSALLL